VALPSKAVVAPVVDSASCEPRSTPAHSEHYSVVLFLLFCFFWFLFFLLLVLVFFCFVLFLFVVFFFFVFFVVVFVFLLFFFFFFFVFFVASLDDDLSRRLLCVARSGVCVTRREYRSRRWLGVVPPSALDRPAPLLDELRHECAVSGGVQAELHEWTDLSEHDVRAAKRSATRE
jgi:energy-coupling factor transporter transmembrane protein EcfT